MCPVAKIMMLTATPIGQTLAAITTQATTAAATATTISFSIQARHPMAMVCTAAFLGRAVAMVAAATVARPTGRQGRWVMAPGRLRVVHQAAAVAAALAAAVAAVVAGVAVAKGFLVSAPLFS